MKSDTIPNNSENSPSDKKQKNKQNLGKISLSLLIFAVILILSVISIIAFNNDIDTIFWIIPTMEISILLSLIISIILGILYLKKSHTKRRKQVRIGLILACGILVGIITFVLVIVLYIFRNA
ncbi:MAG: hypothetical protein ACTSRE_13655 [Promethearchaeota archaeon]